MSFSRNRLYYLMCSNAGDIDTKNVVETGALQPVADLAAAPMDGTTHCSAYIEQLVENRA